MPGPYRSRLLWSSQGSALPANPNVGLTPSPALTATQLATNGNSPILDTSDLNELFIEILLLSFTGGTSPTIQYEWDHLDDDPVGTVFTPPAFDAANPGNAIPLIKPAALTAAGNLLFVLGPTLSTPSNPTGWTVSVWPVSCGVAGQLKWTVTGAPTAINWKAFVYGKRC